MNGNGVCPLCGLLLPLSMLTAHVNDHLDNNSDMVAGDNYSHSPNVVETTEFVNIDDTTDEEEQEQEQEEEQGQEQQEQDNGGEERLEEVGDGEKEDNVKKEDCAVQDVNHVSRSADDVDVETEYNHEDEDDCCVILSGSTSNCTQTQQQQLKPSHPPSSFSSKSLIDSITSVSENNKPHLYEIIQCTPQKQKKKEKRKTKKKKKNGIAANGDVDENKAKRHKDKETTTKTASADRNGMNTNTSNKKNSNSNSVKTTTPKKRKGVTEDKAPNRSSTLPFQFRRMNESSTSFAKFCPSKGLISRVKEKVLRVMAEINANSIVLNKSSPLSSSTSSSSSNALSSFAPSSSTSRAENLFAPVSFSHINFDKLYAREDYAAQPCVYSSLCEAILSPSISSSSSSTSSSTFIVGRFNRRFVQRGHGRVWTCGYRNIQTVADALLLEQQYAKRLFGGTRRIPSLSALQKQIETAWANGFDTWGAKQFNAKLSGGSRWIGPTEVCSLFRYYGLDAKIIHFESTTGHIALAEWVWEYYASDIFNTTAQQHNRDNSTVLHKSSRFPLYFQHDGHSRTIIGIEKKVSSKGIEKFNLLVLDPQHCGHGIDDSLKSKKGWQSMLKRGLLTLKKQHYQLVFVNNIIPDMKLYFKRKSMGCAYSFKDKDFIAHAKQTSPSPSPILIHSRSSTEASISSSTPVAMIPSNTHDDSHHISPSTSHDNPTLPTVIHDDDEVTFSNSSSRGDSNHNGTDGMADGTERERIRKLRIQKLSKLN
eukprot:m.99831 g.99831  ORF g.99831 m.99831 type:complete len:763 (-) comp12545_c0_seq2:136-2424(-)